jgi:hypothetical protein
VQSMREENALGEPGTGSERRSHGPGK